jgi:hypothetical protein
LDKELRIDLRASYHLREAWGLGWSPYALPPGSIILFHFKGKIVGEGVVEKGVQVIDEEHRRKEELGPQYRFFVKFMPELIRAYPDNLLVDKDEFKEIPGKGLYGYFEITPHLRLLQKLVSKFKGTSISKTA